MQTDRGGEDIIKLSKKQWHEVRCCHGLNRHRSVTPGHALSHHLIVITPTTQARPVEIPEERA
jgi:hypothetical protein